jgi:hypothetical protein
MEDQNQFVYVVPIANMQVLLNGGEQPGPVKENTLLHSA